MMLDLSAPTTAGCEQPRHCYLIFDRAQRVIHTSTSVPTVLRVSEEAWTIGGDVMSLLGQVVGPDPDTMVDVDCWLNRTGIQPREFATSPLALLTANGAHTLHLKM